ncbi:MAG: hypothetical protein KGD57_08910 [Candidatus Lokiarchaeota archaeon]|nr:hypothetical protein [Candidatus Lokiarchaeota archaeon]
MTQFLIITSTEDKASLNMRNKLINSDLFHFENTSYSWENNKILKLKYINNSKKDEESFFDKNEVFLGLTKKRLILLDEIKLEPNTINPDILLFASRHASKTERPSFLVHSTGIWNDDVVYGGSPRELSFTSAIMIKAGYLAIQESVIMHNMSKFSSDIEVSHHGPTNLKKPLIFMELGSNSREWEDNKAGIVTSSAIINSLIKYQSLIENKTQKIGVGFGGTHYAPQFKKLIIKTDVAISHICPKYFISSLDKDLINQMLDKCLEKIEYFIIDWKGVNAADKKHLIPLLENYEIPIKKIKDFYV